MSQPIVTADEQLEALKRQVEFNKRIQGLCDEFSVDLVAALQCLPRSVANAPVVPVSAPTVDAAPAPLADAVAQATEVAQAAAPTV